jgi:hypothetical protein
MWACFNIFCQYSPYITFFCHLRCGNIKQADSFPKWACSCLARSPRWAKFAVPAQNRNRPRAGAARPGSKLAHRSAGASCGPERERNPTRRTGSASFSSPRFASAPSSFPTPHMATAVPAACLRAPCSSPAAAARRLGAGGPSLRKRHCAVAPVAAACGPAPPRMLDNGWYPRRRFS